jgi:AraC-like DNA-binding protein
VKIAVAEIRLSLFNLMFKKQFGMSPSQWRQQQQQNGKVQRRLSLRSVPCASSRANRNSATA